MRTVTARELKNRTGRILGYVRRGEPIVITVRGEQVAEVRPLKDGVRRRGLRDARRSQKALVRAVGGKYRGLGTVQEFLDRKRAEIALER